MTERLSEPRRLSDEELEQLGWAVQVAAVSNPEQDLSDLGWQRVLLALRELLARRAADPTPEQRAWYREQAQLFGGVGAMNLKAAEDYWQTGPNYVQLAAHFGRLAMEEE